MLRSFSSTFIVLVKSSSVRSNSKMPALPFQRNKKKFIDKKNERTTTFALVHRSQKDPLAADDDAPQFVLHQLPEVDKRKEEEREHGIFYDDDYDYLQHLKNR